MKKLALILLVSTAARAQTSRFPGTIDNDSSLFVVADNVQSSLNVAMQITDTTAVVASSTGFAPNMIATICDTQTTTGKCTAWEHMLVTAVAGNVLTVTRGIAGTSPLTHAAGKLVSALIDAAHQASLKSAVIAIETALGPNLGNVSPLPITNSSTYNFPPQTPGGTLNAGSCSFTMSPVPPGVQVGDTLYLSGGTGAAEPVSITALVGSTVATTCANAHSGAWTVRSATGGIQEAINALGAAGGSILIPPGTYSLYAAIHVPSNVMLAGSGQGATTLQIANGSLKANAFWQIQGQPGVNCVLCMDSATSYQKIADLTLDANGQNQTWILYGDITGFNASHVTVSGVTVKNHTISPPGGTGVVVQFMGHSPTTANQDNVILNASSIGIAGCTVNNGGGAFYLEGEGNRIISSYATNYCDSPFVIAACDHCGIYNSVADQGGGQTATPTFSLEGSADGIVQGNHCIATGTSASRVCYAAQGANVGLTANGAATGSVFIGNTATHCYDAQWVGANISGTGGVVDTLVSGLRADNVSGNGVVVSQYVNKLTIADSSFLGSSAPQGSGMTIISNGTTPATIVSNMIIKGVTIDHIGSSSAAGIFIFNQAAGGGPPINNLTISDSFIGDTSGTPVQSYGIQIGAGTITNVRITGNRFLGNVTGPMTIAAGITGTNVMFPNVGFPTTLAGVNSMVACQPGIAGNQTWITDSTVNTWGSVVAGGGTNSVLATCNGTSWTVVGH